MSKGAGEERVYTVPLRHAWVAPIKKRVPRALRILREFAKKNMKADEVLISQEVSERLWSRGIQGAPRQIRVRAVRDEDNVVTVYLVKGE
jgi:large subunit ribosomal protein L31e